MGVNWKSTNLAQMGPIFSWKCSTTVEVVNSLISHSDGHHLSRGKISCLPFPFFSAAQYVSETVGPRTTWQSRNLEQNFSASPQMDPTLWGKSFFFVLCKRHKIFGSKEQQNAKTTKSIALHQDGPNGPEKNGWIQCTRELKVPLTSQHLFNAASNALECCKDFIVATAQQTKS